MKKRILVIDDEPDFTHFIKLALETEGYYRVFEENESRKAIAAARQCDPDLIILDMMMIEPDGSEVAAMLREDSRLREVPILFLTALVCQEEPGQSPLATGRHYLPKPVDLPVLLEHVEDLCSKRNKASIATRSAAGSAARSQPKEPRRQIPQSGNVS